MGWVVDHVVDPFLGNTAADAAEKGADLQYDATRYGIDKQVEARDQARRDLSPFRNLATRNVLSQYVNAANTPTSTDGLPSLQNIDYANDPLIKALTNRTSEAVLNARAASGKLNSPETQLALNEALAPIYFNRTSQLADQRRQLFDERYNTQNQTFNQLQNIIAGAQNAAAGQGTASLSTANQISELSTQGANAQAGGLTGVANARADGLNNMMRLGGMIAASDRRLKSNIVAVGKYKDYNVYEYDIFGRRERGVMAQEVRDINPDAVIQHESGYLLVNYGAL